MEWYINCTSTPFLTQLLVQPLPSAWCQCPMLTCRSGPRTMATNSPPKTTRFRRSSRGSRRAGRRGRCVGSLRYSYDYIVCEGSLRQETRLFHTTARFCDTAGGAGTGAVRRYARCAAGCRSAARALSTRSCGAAGSRRQCGRTGRCSWQPDRGLPRSQWRHCRCECESEGSRSSREV